MQACADRRRRRWNGVIGSAAFVCGRRKPAGIMRLLRCCAGYQQRCGPDKACIDRGAAGEPSRWSCRSDARRVSAEPPIIFAVPRVESMCIGSEPFDDTGDKPGHHRRAMFGDALPTSMPLAAKSVLSHQLAPFTLTMPHSPLLRIPAEKRLWFIDCRSMPGFEFAVTLVAGSLREPFDAGKANV